MRIEPIHPNELKIKLESKPLVLFGAGSLGQNIAEYCEAHSISVVCFADNNVTGKTNGKIVISPQNLKENYPNANIVISSNIFYDEIKTQLKAMDFSEEQLLSYRLFLPDKVIWKDLDSTANWKRMRIRVKKMSEWIDENSRSVIDYGAGEMFLKSLLSPNVKYYPVDYIRRSNETVLCDLNSGDFPDIHADVAMLSGILELLTTSESLLHHVCSTTDHQIILTYMTLDKFPDIAGRRASAYVNDFTEKQIVELLAQFDFVLKSKLTDPGHNVDTLFLFEKSAN